MPGALADGGDARWAAGGGGGTASVWEVGRKGLAGLERLLRAGLIVGDAAVTKPSLVCV